ncbi:hypothetical protein [aff. Roholtiella sp. LEGE 12411]|uniref:hypothetical protein n=1 Tax=aff. Roholtiella sp. LEGE 12411 TaxID=1828822 RepID=UPI0018802B7F|nr:hypothetical protein [aff. Roholtiella sp. LEGE 12411]MBE9039029.1 hypothetical protein [aff. Roholtiella sp. LEGE 12411]
MRILKILVHKLTPEQEKELEGNEVVELKAIAPALASFLANTPDDWDALAQQAQELVQIAKGFDAALLPGGSPAFAWLLAKVWPSEIKVLFAHSVRDSVEKQVEKFVPIEGTEQFRKETVVEKALLFNHVRFF